MIRIATTLACAFLGGLLAWLAGLPAGWLLGSVTAVTLLAVTGFSVAVPDRLRDPAFVVLGISLGSGITANALSEMIQWLPSLFLLTLSVIAVMALNALILVRGFAMTPETALVATSPGALSMAIAMATSGFGDIKAVTVLQSVRLFLLVTALPLIIEMAEGQTPNQALNQAASMPLAVFAALLVAGILIGLAFAKFGAPAPFLLGGLFLSVALHASDLIVGAPATPFIVAAFLVIGATVGARFSGIAMSSLLRFSLASLIVTGSAIVLSAVFAFVSARLLGFPFGQVWVSYAPGGVEAMAAMALALGYDPAFVAAHHLFRILALMLGLPLLIGLYRRKKKTV